MVNDERRAELFRRYREGPAQIEAAVAGLGPGQLDTSVDGWTPRLVVHHVADSEMTAAIRLRRLIAEESPAIEGYDQELFARRLHYDSRPIEPSLAAIAAARASTAAILDALSPAEWERAGTHNEVGPYSVDRWLEIYSAHCHDHADQIRRAVGKP